MAKKGYGNHRTFGQYAADQLAEWAGSWTFIAGFALFLVVWVALNSYWILFHTWDPYPFILLNLCLSCLAAIQAPIILMSQNRAAERDRAVAQRDHYVNRKAEKEIKTLQKHIFEIKEILSKQPQTTHIKALEEEIRHIENEMSETLHYHI